MSLTQAKVDRAQVKNRDYRISDIVGSGLSLRVYKSGNKSYFFRYVDWRGRSKDKKVGDATKISLKEARRRSLQHQDDLNSQAGVDEDSFSDLTFGGLVAMYLESTKFKSRRPATRTLYRKTLDNHILPEFRAVRANGIRKGTLFKFLEDLVNEHGGHGTARICRSVLSVVFKWGAQRDYIESDPMSAVPHVTSIKRGKRTLSNSELATLWRSIEYEGRVSKDVADAAKILILTAQRPRETTKMRVQDIDLENKVWNIPDEITKNKKPHRVPLSDFALEILRPAIRGRSKGLMFKCNQQAPTNMFKRFLDDDRFNGKFTARDLRRTFASEISRVKKGVGEDLIRRVINHSTVSRGALGHYNHYDYLDEKRELLQAWSDHIESLVA